MGTPAEKTKSSIAIGMRIKRWREKNNEKAADVAKKYGVSQPKWSLMENGRAIFDSELIFQLARFMGVEPAYLLTGGKQISPGVVPGEVDEEAKGLAIDLLRIQAALSRVAAGLLDGTVSAEAAKQALSSAGEFPQQIADLEPRHDLRKKSS
jgi:transcriptional regulator with XRE-family HTH domain